VQDTGIGISEEHQKSLFQKFTQVDASTTRQFGGTGLGLAISKKLVHLMGGEIGVKSKKGEGATFWFDLPLKSGNPDAKGCKDEHETQNILNIQNKLKDKRILVVDDNLVNQQVVMAMLNNFAVRAETVNNGQEAIEALSVIPYDLVLMDVQMPVMDGMEATKIIRSPDSPVLNPDIPIIALTAHAFSEDINRFLEAGMSGHLAKPIIPEELAKCLEKWLTHPSAFNILDKVEDGQRDSTTVSIEKEAVPTLDIDSLTARTMGDKEVMALVISTFLETTPEEIKNLDVAIKAENFQAAQKIAHTIKGSSANIGAMKLSDIASKLEELLKNKHEEKNMLLEHASLLRSEFDKLREQLSKISL
jgi:CheY-like chemotaxis protein/HPt (histidine-containing phosphotransfer) domain-containing protein